MNPRRRRQNRQRRLDRAAVLVVASRVSIPRRQALRAFANGDIRVIALKQKRLTGRLVHGTWGPKATPYNSVMYWPEDSADEIAKEFWADYEGQEESY